MAAPKKLMVGVVIALLGALLEPYGPQNYAYKRECDANAIDQDVHSVPPVEPGSKAKNGGCYRQAYYSMV